MVRLCCQLNKIVNKHISDEMKSSIPMDNMRVMAKPLRRDVAATSLTSLLGVQ
jgi:hypothetical protein